MLVHIIITGKYASNTDLYKKCVMFVNVHWSYGLGKCQNLLVTDVYGKQTIEQLRNSHLNHLLNCNLFLNCIHLFSLFHCKIKMYLDFVNLSYIYLINYYI